MFFYGLCRSQWKLWFCQEISHLNDSWRKSSRTNELMNKRRKETSSLSTHKWIFNFFYFSNSLFSRTDWVGGYHCIRSCLPQPAATMSVLTVRQKIIIMGTISKTFDFTSRERLILIICNALMHLSINYNEKHLMWTWSNACILRNGSLL